MGTQIRHVNRVMNYLAGTRINCMCLFFYYFFSFKENFSKCLTSNPLTFVKNMNYSTCTLATNQQG
jgi:hypothetical protein